MLSETQEQPKFQICYVSDKKMLSFSNKNISPYGTAKVLASLILTFRPNTISPHMVWAFPMCLYLIRLWLFDCLFYISNSSGLEKYCFCKWYTPPYKDVTQILLKQNFAKELATGNGQSLWHFNKATRLITSGIFKSHTIHNKYRRACEPLIEFLISVCNLVTE